MTSSQPKIEERDVRPYVAIPAHVTDEASFRAAADSSFPELFRWLGAVGVPPAGPPLIRYLEQGADGDPALIHLGVPVAPGIDHNGPVVADLLPAGQWAVFTHVGPYRSGSVTDLGDAHARIRAWAADEAVELGESVETYVVGPVEEKDFLKWETEIAYLVG